MKKAFSLVLVALAASLAACGHNYGGNQQQIFLLSPPADSTLPDGALNVGYVASFSLLSGGKAPYSFGGIALPPGLTLTTTSGTSFVISGTPTQAGTGILQVQVADAAQNVEVESYQITIDGGATALTVTPATLGNFSPNVPFFQNLTTNGQPPIVWSVSGQLPTGITLGSSSSTLNTLAGTPSRVGQFNFTIIVNDATGAAGAATYSVFVP